MCRLISFSIAIFHIYDNSEKFLDTLALRKAKAENTLKENNIVIEKNRTKICKTFYNIDEKNETRTDNLMFLFSIF